MAQISLRKIILRLYNIEHPEYIHKNDHKKMHDFLKNGRPLNHNTLSIASVERNKKDNILNI